jgi:hypothetical protein
MSPEMALRLGRLFGNSPEFWMNAQRAVDLYDAMQRLKDTGGDVLGYLVGGVSKAAILAGFPQLTHEDVLACLGFAANRERRLASLPRV